MEVRYYATATGNSPIRRFIEQLPQSAQEDFFLAIDRLARGESLVQKKTQTIPDKDRRLICKRVKEI